MAVFKRAGSPYWQVEFTLNGEMVRKSSGTTNKQEAKDKEAEWRTEIKERQAKGSKPTITLGAACVNYYNTNLKPGGKPKKLVRDRLKLKQITDQFGEDRLLSDITQAEVADWRNEMIATGNKGATVNRISGVLRSVISRAREDGREVPDLTFKSLPEDPGRVRWLTEQEEERLLEECAPHIRQVVQFLMDSGARIGEALSLTWDKIIWGMNDRATVLLPALMTKTKKARRIPLTMRSSAMLKEIRNERGNYPHVFMYMHPMEKMLTPIASIRYGFEGACERAGITDFHIHDCRHHFASRLAQKGASLHQIKELLGHTDLKMTLRYAHLCESNLDGAVALLDRPRSAA